MFTDKHGQSRTKIYKVWKSMKARCHNPNHYAYKRYGGAGILVCDRWFSSWENFRDDMGPRPEGYTLERVDNMKGYEPSNCKWVTRKDNQRNRTCTHIVSYQGELLTIPDIAKIVGIPTGTLASRLAQAL